MLLRRSHRLRFDRRARLLFSALWIAPVVVPMALALASSWMPHQAVASFPTRPTAAVSANEDVARARLRVAMVAGTSHLIPGSAGILVARLAGGPIEKKRSGGQARLHPVGMQVFRNVAVAENLRLNSNGMIVQLAGVAPVATDATCRRLDGVTEPCSTRAMSRLEILTRGRAVTCDIRDDQARDDRTDDAMLGVCRAGKIDIAEDLVRNGLARRIGT
jgi:endonuclease YncB( thermonuclease family)